MVKCYCDFMRLTPKVQKAINKASELHRNQVRKIE